MDTDLATYYAFVRSRPLFPTGGYSEAVELAHVKGLPMEGIGGRLLSEFKPRKGELGSYLVLPVTPEEHQVGYPGSIHAIGEDAWLEKHGVTRAHALGYILGNVLRFHRAVAALTNV